MSVPLFDESSPTDWGGLQLSNIENCKPSSLQPNPLNDVFDDVKNADYLLALKNDIKSHGILNALIATKSGLLIEGHSRLSVAKLLGLPSVPVRYILSDLSDEALKERLYMANLQRFEISKDQRLKLFGELYSHIFYDEHAPIPESLAATMQLSPSQVRNEKQLLLRALATKRAKHDTSAVTVAEIKEARNDANRIRRDKERLKRMRWQQLDAPPSHHTHAAPPELILSHHYQSSCELDIHKAYKLISLGSSAYAIYTAGDQLVAQLDPRTFRNLEELDAFAKTLILAFHTLRHHKKVD
jgi:ParB-like nuclease domain